MGKHEIPTDSLNETLTEQMKSFFAQQQGEPSVGGLHSRVIREVEKVLITTTLEATGHNQLRAAEILGINRNTLKRKMGENGIKPKMRARRRRRSLHLPQDH